MTRRKKQSGGYRYTANDRDIKRRSWCPLTLLLLAGWPTFDLDETAARMAELQGNLMAAARRVAAGQGVTG